MMPEQRFLLLRFFYVTRKNPLNVQHKLGFRKVCVRLPSFLNPPFAITPLQFDPVVKQHVLFTEAKISRKK